MVKKNTLKNNNKTQIKNFNIEDKTFNSLKDEIVKRNLKKSYPDINDIGNWYEI